MGCNWLTTPNPQPLNLDITRIERADLFDDCRFLYLPRRATMLTGESRDFSKNRRCLITPTGSLSIDDSQKDYIGPGLVCAANGDYLSVNPNGSLDDLDEYTFFAYSRCPFAWSSATLFSSDFLAVKMMNTGGADMRVTHRTAAAGFNNLDFDPYNDFTPAFGWFREFVIVVRHQPGHLLQVTMIGDETARNINTVSKAASADTQREVGTCYVGNDSSGIVPWHKPAPTEHVMPIWGMGINARAWSDTEMYEFLGTGFGCFKENTPRPSPQLFLVSGTTAVVPAITDVGGDNILEVDNTTVTVTGTGFTGFTNITIDDGTTTVPQADQVEVGDTSVTFTFTRSDGTDQLPTSIAGRTLTLSVIGPGGTATQAITLNPETTWGDKLVASPDTTDASLLSIVLTAGTTPANGDTLEWETNSGAVTVAANGVVTCTSLPQTFDWRFWDASENELSSTGTVTVSEMLPPALAAGWSEVTVVSADLTSGSLLNGISPTPIDNDVIQWHTLGGKITVNADGTYTGDGNAQSFQWKFWDNSEDTTTAVATATVDGTASANALTMGRLRDSGNYSSVIQAGVLDYVLDAGQYEATESWESIEVIAPRPYTEYTGGGAPTSGDSRKHVYTHWVTDTTWRVPIGVRGCAFPGIYILSDAPTGMVIEQTRSPNDWSLYGWIKWPVASITAGTHYFFLHVIDQEQQIETIPMCLNVADTNGVRIDSNVVGGSSNGTSWADAYDAFTDVYQSGFADKLAICRGTMTLGATCAIDDAEPPCWLGDPDEDHFIFAISATGQHVHMDEVGSVNKAILHCKFDGAPTSGSHAANPKQLWMKQGQSKSVVADIICDNQDLQGTDGSDQNNGILIDGDDTSPATYVLLKGIYVDNFRSDGPFNNGGPIKLLDVQNSWVEDVTHGTQAGTVQNFMILKHGSNDCGGRLIRIDDVTCAQSPISVQRSSTINSGYENKRVVFEYCKVKESTAGKDTFRFSDGAAGGNDDHENNVLRRCTSISASTARAVRDTANSGSTLRISNCIGVNTGDDALPESSGAGWTVTASGNITEATAGAAGLNANGDFLDTNDPNYAKKGWEIE